MKSFKLEKPPAQPEQPPLTAIEQRSLWLRVAVSLVLVILTIILSSYALIILGFGFLSVGAVFLAGLTISLTAPYWRFRHSTYLRPRLGLSASYVCLSLLAAVMQVIVLNIPHPFLTLSLFVGIALSLILPHLHFKEWTYQFLLLVAWFVLTGFASPPLVKQYRVTTAANIVPPYPALQRTYVGYTPGSWPDIEANVAYRYRTENQQENYNKLRDYYKEELGKKGWVVATSNSNERTHDFAYTMFNQPGHPTPFIAISFYKETPNEIRVDVSF